MVPRQMTVSRSKRIAMMPERGHLPIGWHAIRAMSGADGQCGEHAFCWT